MREKIEIHTTVISGIKYSVDRLKVLSVGRKCFSQVDFLTSAHRDGKE